MSGSTGDANGWSAQMAYQAMWDDFRGKCDCVTPLDKALCEADNKGRLFVNIARSTETGLSMNDANFKRHADMGFDLATIKGNRMMETKEETPTAVLRERMKALYVVAAVELMEARVRRTAMMLANKNGFPNI